MRGEVRASSEGGRKTRAAERIRRHGGFWYAVIFLTSINAAVRRKCSFSMLRTRAICFANRAKSGGFAVTRRVRRRGGENGE